MILLGMYELEYDHGYLMLIMAVMVIDMVICMVMIVIKWLVVVCLQLWLHADVVKIKKIMIIGHPLKVVLMAVAMVLDIVTSMGLFVI